MGCDIHMHVEYRHDDNGPWYCGDYFRMSNLSKTNLNFICVPIHVHRNYALFATLADVRNYGDTKYIDKPRGLPKDVTDYVKNEYEDWLEDAHSCSYCTLRELIEFHNQHNPLKRSGMISQEQIHLLEHEGVVPTTWCQGTNIAGYERREWKEPNDTLIPLIDKLKERADELNLIYDFLWNSEKQETLEEVMEKSNNIRIVFWFDN